MAASNSKSFTSLVVIDTRSKPSSIISLSLELAGYLRKVPGTESLYFTTYTLPSLIEYDDELCSLVDQSCRRILRRPDNPLNRFCRFFKSETGSDHIKVQEAVAFVPNGSSFFEAEKLDKRNIQGHFFWGVDFLHPEISLDSQSTQFWNLRSTSLPSNLTFLNRNTGRPQFSYFQVSTGLCLFSMYTIFPYDENIRAEGSAIALYKKLNLPKTAIDDYLNFLSTCPWTMYELEGVTRLALTIADLGAFILNSKYRNKIRVSLDIPDLQYADIITRVVSEGTWHPTQGLRWLDVVKNRRTELIKLFTEKILNELKRRGVSTLSETVEVVAPQGFPIEAIVRPSIRQKIRPDVENIRKVLRADPSWELYFSHSETARNCTDTFTLAQESYVHHILRPFLTDGSDILSIHIDDRREWRIFSSARSVVQDLQKRRQNNLVLFGIFPLSKIFTENGVTKSDLYLQESGCTDGDEHDKFTQIVQKCYSPQN